MSNTCYDIKKEFEALNALKQKFVSACVEAGNVDDLSKSELIRLKKLKRTLEQARNAFEERIENKSVRMWKNIYKEITTTVVEDSGPYHGMRIGDLTGRHEFRKQLIDGILRNIYEAKFGSSFFSNAIHAFNAAVKYGLIADEDKARVRELLDTDASRSRITRYIVNMAENGKNNGAAAYKAFTRFNAGIELGLLSIDDHERIKASTDRPGCKGNFVAFIHSAAKMGERFNGNVWGATVSFPVALRMDLLTKENKERIQKLMEEEEFQRRIIEVTVIDVKLGLTDGKLSMEAVLALNAIKELIELSRRRRGQ